MFYWVSFATQEEHLGCCIVEAEHEMLVVPKTHALGINPGGSVKFHELKAPAGKKIKPEAINRMISPNESQKMIRDPELLFTDAGPLPWIFVGLIAAGDDARKTSPEKLKLRGGYILRAKDQAAAVALGLAHKFVKGDDYQCVTADFPTIAGKKIDPSYVHRILTVEEATTLRDSKENRAAIMIDDDGIEPAPLPEVDVSDKKVHMREVTSPIDKMIDLLFGRLGGKDDFITLPDFEKWGGDMISDLLVDAGADPVYEGFVKSDDIAKEMLVKQTLADACKMVDLAHMLTGHLEICDESPHPFRIPSYTIAAIAEALTIAAHRVVEHLKQPAPANAS
jgi:hypothetical protein